MADMVFIRNPPMLDKILVEERFSSEQLAQDLIARGKDACYFPDTDAIIEQLIIVARPDDVILIMSNGAFDNIHERLLKRL